MPVPHRNGEAPGDNHAAEASSERWGLAEVITEVEALRGLLQDAATRTTRLLSALKLQRRQNRALQAAVASLKQLQLDR